jgi:hypothetical protein
MLRALLDDQIPRTNSWFDRLVELTVVEPFHAHEAWNVHEVTRLALRSRLAHEGIDRFRKFSERAAALFEGDAPAQLIERLYHLLLSEPDRGADDLRRLWKAWMRAGKLQPLQALAKNLEELCSRDILAARARAYALVALGEIQEDRIALAAWERLAREAVDGMTVVGDEIGLVDAHSLLGKVQRA